MEENNKQMRELYKLYLELGHEVFEEKIKKPMELYFHSLHDSSNVISMSSLNTFDANDMQSHKLGDAMFDEDDHFSSPTFDENICYDDYNDERDIFSPPTIEEEIYYDYNMPPIYDDYCDDTYAIKNTFLYVDHDKNDLCDSYIVDFIHDATENYYERGTYAYRYLNIINFPLFMLKVSKLHLFCLPILISLCFNELFLYKIPLHRKWV